MKNKHTQYDLKQMQSLSLDSKIRMTQQRIRQWYDEFDGMVYVSRSGGKDSDVLGHIVKEMYPDVPHVFVNTGLEHDSVRKHGELVADETIKPEMRFDDVIIKYEYPVISKNVSKRVSDARKNENSYAFKMFNGTYMRSDGGKSLYCVEKWEFLLDAPFKISDICCAVMKKKPAKHYAKTTNRKPFIGTMADESKQRLDMWIKNGCNGFDMKTQVSNPLSFWTEQDILHYIKLNNIEIASAYGDIVYTDEDGMQYDNDVFNIGMDLITTGESRTG